MDYAEVFASETMTELSRQAIFVVFSDQTWPISMSRPDLQVGQESCNCEAQLWSHNATIEL